MEGAEGDRPLGRSLAGEAAPWRGWCGQSPQCGSLGIAAERKRKRAYPRHIDGRGKYNLDRAVQSDTQCVAVPRSLPNQGFQHPRAGRRDGELGQKGYAQVGVERSREVSTKRGGHRADTTHSRRYVRSVKPSTASIRVATSPSRNGRPNACRVPPLLP